MGSRVFRFTCLVCILCKDALGGSATTTQISALINDAYRSTDGGVDDAGDTRIERSIETRARLPDEITPRDYQFETPQDSLLARDLSARMEGSSGFRDEGCSRYCIQQLRNSEGDRSFEGINLFWSFAGNESRADILSLENSSRLKILRRTSADVSILGDTCQIYMNLNCPDTLNNRRNKSDTDLASNRESIDTLRDSLRRSISKFSKRLLHRTNLNGYTETRFHLDANVTGIVVDVRGDLIRAALAMPASRTMRRPGITMSLARTHDAKGVAIGARNPPPGGWCVKLTGVADSKYSFDVTALFDAGGENDTKSGIIDVESTNDELARALNEEHATQIEATTTMIKRTEEFVDETKGESSDDTTDERVDPILSTSSGINREPKLVFERSTDIADEKDSGDETIADDSPLHLSSSFKSKSMGNIINDSTLRNNSSMNYGDFRISRNSSNAKMMVDGMISQQDKIQTRSSEIASLNEDSDTDTESFASYNASARMVDGDKNQEVSAKSITTNKDDIFGTKKILIEVNSNSNLLAVPGIHRTIFDVTNNCFLVVRYEIRARSSPFRVYNIQPRYAWLYPGQTNRVAVDIFVPAEASQDTVNTLTVSIGGTQISEKTVYIYTQAAFSKGRDDIKPTIEYSFNNNCAGKLHKDRCDRTYWSADITVQDYDSGLKSVTSSPERIYPRTEFISGTKERITFHYLSTCCSTTARITAVDASNNEYSRVIDVTEWDNLSQGEIAAITVGALLLLLLLIFLIIAIVYCVRRRNSHDLPYTQRYGSRPPARPERTSF